MMKGPILVNCLTRLLSKDEATYSHSLRLGSMAKIMAKHLNFDDEQKEKLIIGCCLHDYGKIFIPEKILLKESALISKEWEIMKRHPVIGVMLLNLEENVDKEIIEVVKYHHEYWILK
jgi:putative nucleotidyltransferase with HDIG domain